MMTPLFTPDKLAAREQDTRDLVNRLIDDFIETGTCDFQDQLGKPLPGILTCQLMGLPADRWRRGRGIQNASPFLRGQRIRPNAGARHDGDAGSRRGAATRAEE
jgi:cytochrome P450